MSQPPPTRSAHAMSSGEWIMLITLSVLWGGSFFFNRVAVKELPPMTIVFGRLALAALILQLVAHAFGAAAPWRRQVWQAFLVMGLLNNLIPMVLIVWGQGRIASGVASILNATSPLFTLVIAHFATTDEKMTPLRLTGVVIGFIGVAVLMGVQALSFSGETLAQLACLGAALSYGFASVFGKRFARMGLKPLGIAAGQLSASSLVLLPLMLIVEQPWHLAAPSWPAIAAVIGLATLSSALAYVLFFRILSTAGASNLSLVTFLIPPSAILLGIVFLGETLAMRHMVGLALIGLGLLLIDGRLVRRFYATP